MLKSVLNWKKFKLFFNFFFRCWITVWSFKSNLRAIDSQTHFFQRESQFVRVSSDSLAHQISFEHFKAQKMVLFSAVVANRANVSSNWILFSFCKLFARVS
jgi:hypothetical protein